MKAGPKPPISKFSNKKEPKAFWITNFSDRNVSLSDLAFTIRKGRSYNLLDKRHFSYTLEQLIASLRSGSLHKKRHLVRLVAGPPQQISIKKKVSDQPMQMRKRSAVKVEEVQYEELDISDEQFAQNFLEDYE